MKEKFSHKEILNSDFNQKKDYEYLIIRLKQIKKTIALLDNKFLL